MPTDSLDGSLGGSVISLYKESKGPSKRPRGCAWVGCRAGRLRRCLVQFMSADRAKCFEGQRGD